MGDGAAARLLGRLGLGLGLLALLLRRPIIIVIRRVRPKQTFLSLNRLADHERLAVLERDEELLDFFHRLRLRGQQMGHAVRGGQRKFTHLHHQVLQAVRLELRTYEIVQDEDEVIVNLDVREAAVLVTILDVFLPGSNHEIIMKIMNDTDDNANNDNNLV